MPMSFKAFALVLVAGCSLMSSGTMARDGRNRDNAVDIIGGVIGGAIDAEAAAQEEREHAKQCVRLQRKCEHGSGWACERYEEDCND
jgi:hypothetical protein